MSRYIFAVVAEKEELRIKKASSEDEAFNIKKQLAKNSPRQESKLAHIEGKLQKWPDLLIIS
ncbi:MAG: hypothetical protein GY774_19960 [Planctomycetes bacterium]|nr:hypothetical protein [Planctomycetota bacterium]